MCAASAAPPPLEKSTVAAVVPAVVFPGTLKVNARYILLYRAFRASHRWDETSEMREDTSGASRGPACSPHQTNRLLLVYQPPGGGAIVGDREVSLDSGAADLPPVVA